MEDIHIDKLFIYPIKSVSGIEVTEAQAEEKGFRHDRRWMLIDDDNRFITQRKFHELALIDTSIEDGMIKLRHRKSPGFHAEVPLEVRHGKRVISVIWKDEVEVLWPGLPADEWFSEMLKTSCRLVFMPREARRQVDEKYVPQTMNTSLSDGYPYLLTNEASLADINNRAHARLTMRRFRPNIVVSGTEAFAEDHWKRFRAGDAVFRIVKPCARCVVTTIDPDTGAKGKEPLKTLSEYRKDGHKILFGQNMILEKPGIVQVGAPVELLE